MGNFFENLHFSGKGRQLLHIYTLRELLISYVKLDHTLYSINYGIKITFVTCTIISVRAGT